MAKVVGTADWRDRIGKKEGPTTMALAGDAFVETRDPRYLSDAYQYYLQGMGGGQDAAGIPATTVAKTPAAPVTTGGDQGLAVAPGITGASVVQPTSDPFLASGAAGGARLPTMDKAAAVAAMTQGPAYTTSDPFLASGAAGGARLPTTPTGPRTTLPSGDVFATDDPMLQEKIDYTQDPEAQSWWQSVQSGARSVGDFIKKFGEGAANAFQALSKVSPTAMLLSAIEPASGRQQKAVKDQLVDSGVVLDDIGRIVQQPGIPYNDPRNVMAGYNPGPTGLQIGDTKIGGGTVQHSAAERINDIQDTIDNLDNQWSQLKKSDPEAFEAKKKNLQDRQEALKEFINMGAATAAGGVRLEDYDPGTGVPGTKKAGEVVYGTDYFPELGQEATMPVQKNVIPSEAVPTSDFQTRFTAKGPDDTWMGPREISRTAPDFVRGVDTTTPEKKGIMSQISNAFFPEGNWQDIKSTAPDQRTYNIEATKDMVENLPGGIVKDVLAPAGAFVLSPFYDTLQASQRAADKYGAETSPYGGIVDDMEVPAGPTMGQLAQAIDAENPLSSMWERTIGAAAPLAERFGIGVDEAPTDVMGPFGYMQPSAAPKGAAGSANFRRPGQDVITRDAPVELGPVQPGEGRIWPDRPETTLEYGTTRPAGIDAPMIEPVDWSELDDLEADSMAGTLEDMPEEESFLDRFKSDSAKEYEGYDQSEKAAVDKAYGAGGVMEGYNIVSGFGKGPKATVDKRIKDFEKNWSSEKIAEMKKDPNSNYSKLKDLQNKIGKPEDPVDEKIDDTDPADVGTMDNIFDDIDTGVGEFDITPTPDQRAGDAAEAEEITKLNEEVLEARQRQGEQVQEIQQQKIARNDNDKDRQQRDTGVAKVAENRYETKSGDVYASAYEAAEKSDNGGGGGCFLKGTPVTMADGSTKAIEQVDLGDNVAKGGKVFATGKFLVENLHDYKGIKVSGSHMVSEDGNWVRVEDSKHGKALGDDEHTVYVFGAENRRILINDILFTDYFEVNEQDKLLNNEKDFFNNWKLYAKQDSGNNVNIINAS